MRISSHEGERDTHICEYFGNLGAVFFLVNADVDQYGVKVFLFQLLESGRKMMHRSRYDVSEIIDHVLDHLGDQKVALDDEHPGRFLGRRMLIVGHFDPAS
jgi:hypothetical protein